MTAAYTLLVLALQLLTLVSTTPNVSPELRARAISVANTAIFAANAEMAPVTTVQSTHVMQAPVLGATMSTPMPSDQSKISAEVIKTLAPDPVNGLPYGMIIIRVRVFDSEGKTVNGAQVTMDGIVTRNIDTRETPESTDYYTSFSYMPKNAGDATVVFTSGSLSTSLSVKTL